MRILDAVNCYLRDNGGLIPAARKVLHLTWQVVRLKGIQGLLMEVRNTARMRANQADQMWRVETIESAARSRKITILSTQHTLYVAHYLANSLQAEGFDVAIITATPSFGYDNGVHIVICPQMFSRLPKAMVAFQMEQSISDRWFTKKYLRTLSNSLAILDYSKTNIAYLVAKGIPYRNIYYLPVRELTDYPAFLCSQGIELPPRHEKKYEVLFYGDTHCARRQKILDELSKNFRLEVANGLFGAALYEKIRAARAVVNLHYYEGALLETTRICECLSLGVPVVSESSTDRGDYPELGQSVQFVETGDIRGMIDALKRVINHEQDNPVSSPRQSPLATNSFYLLRFLTAFGLVSFDRIATLAGPPDFVTGRVCLSLPETPDRRAAFLSRKLGQFEIFDGLRHTQGWVGCALSYKYLARQAIVEKLGRLTICEDDAILDEAAITSLSIIESYLDQLGDDWDVFSGLIAHLHSNVTVSRVENYRGMTFVHLDRMTSTVFNIYNHSVLNVLSAWNERNTNPASNTIDRYLESQRQLRVVTTLPFIAAHSEDETSTLWGFENMEYTGLIRSSQDLLAQKVQQFLNARPNTTTI